MHSRVFQISKAPIYVEDYITESSIPEWFFGSIADYVVTTDDRKGDIEWLHRSSGISVNDPLEYFTVDSDKYFIDKFQGFVSRLDEVKRLANFDDFSGNGNDPYTFAYKLAMLSDAYDDKYGFYIIDDEDGQLLTLDYFVRFIAEEDCKYYIGGVLDYHF